MRVLLSGVTGFVGRAVLRSCLERGWRLRVLVRDPGRLRIPPDAGDRVELWRGELRNPASLAGIGAGMDAVAHLAGVVAPRRLRDFEAVNSRGSAHLACACGISGGPSRWVQLSSLAATGPGDPVRDGDPPRPVSRYGHSKLAGEAAVSAGGFPEQIVLRPPAVYGPGDTAFLPMFRAISRGLPVLLPRDGPRALSLLHVEDLAAALVAALEAPSGAEGQVFHVAGPESPTPAELAAAIGKALGRPARILGIPLPLLWGLAALLAPLRALSGRPRYLNRDKLQELAAPAWTCESRAADRLLGWRARRSLPEGLGGTARAYREAGLLPPAT